MKTAKAEPPPHARSSLAESVTRRQTIDLLEQLVTYQRDRQQPTDRTEKCLKWCQTSQDWSLIPPPAVLKFLLEHPIELLKRPAREAAPVAPVAKPTAPKSPRMTRICSRCKGPCDGSIESLGNPICGKCFDTQLETSR